MSKIIISTKCSDCTHKNLCKYETDVNTVNDVKKLEQFDKEMSDLPIVVSIVCTEFDKIKPNIR